MINSKHKTSNEINYIANYLLLLDNFIALITKFNSNKQLSLEERLNKIIIQLKAEFLESGIIAYMTGMKGNKCYIILDGEVSFLYAFDEECDLTENDYLFYLMRLRVYEEFELLNRCLSVNKKVDIKFNTYFLEYLNNEKLSLSEIHLENFGLKSEYYREYKNFISKAKIHKHYNEKDYNERLTSWFSTKQSTNITKHTFTIFKYKSISTKGKGEIFGNLVMDSTSSKRYYISK